MAGKEFAGHQTNNWYRIYPDCSGGRIVTVTFNDLLSAIYRFPLC